MNDVSQVLVAFRQRHGHITDATGNVDHYAPLRKGGPVKTWDQNINIAYR